MWERMWVVLPLPGRTKSPGHFTVPQVIIFLFPFSHFLPDGENPQPQAHKIISFHLVLTYFLT